MDGWMDARATGTAGRGAARCRGARCAWRRARGSVWCVRARRTERRDATRRTTPMTNRRRRDLKRTFDGCDANERLTTSDAGDGRRATGAARMRTRVSRAMHLEVARRGDAATGEGGKGRTRTTRRLRRGDVSDV
jgi:hypothetical protein